MTTGTEPTLQEPRSFRKKPVVIQAFRFTKELAFGFLEHDKPLPWDLHCNGSWHAGDNVVHCASIPIKTLEGVMIANLGDWVIKGIKGEFYPCKHDIFEATYDPA